MFKGFVEKVLLVVETIIVGYQVVELPHIIVLVAAVTVAVMATVVLVARHTNMMYGMHFDENHTHADATPSTKENTTNCTLCAKHDRSRYF
jgi:hypothetical protein